MDKHEIVISKNSSKCELAAKNKMSFLTRFLFFQHFNYGSLKMNSSRSNFALKAGVIEYNSSIQQNRLPSEENILRAFLYFSANALSNSLPGQLKSVKWDSAKYTLTIIKQVYAKANTPMLSDDGVCKKILKLHDEYKAMIKIPEK